MQRLEWTRFFPDTLVRTVFRTATRLYPLGFRGWGILNRNSLAPFDSFLAEVSLFQPRERDAVLAARLRPSNGDIFSRGRALARQGGSQDLLSQIQFVDQMLYLPDDILVKVDRASMAVALETRAPLLDYRLAEFMATVPAELRYRNKTKKYLLKQAARGILPSEIIDRGKMGFGVPLKHWFRKEAAGFARDVLTSREARERGLLNQREVALNLERHAAGRRDFSAKLWSLVFFELWCRKWLDRPVAAGVRP
jgi:asparagine synthase (glutamine-hydrolysing)